MDLSEFIKKEERLEVSKVMAKAFDTHYDFEAKALTFNERPGVSKKIGTYIISKELIIAVNAAIASGRPLLLKGAPGCGKTQLAQAVANYFYKEDAFKYYFEWHVKSTSKAKDGAYSFDHVSRLRDATISQHNEDARKRAGNPDNYIHLGAMGLAFAKQEEKGKRPILLIDEIDKGDIDFPNDLLLELDEMRFKITEKDDTYIAAPKGTKPLVIITSNNERELPPAFLRRCLYYYIPPFQQELLEVIASKNVLEYFNQYLADGETAKTDIPVGDFVSRFIKTRDSASGSKIPSTSEMLDWLKLICFKMYTEKLEIDKVVDDPQLQKLALKLNAS